MPVYFELNSAAFNKLVEITIIFSLFHRM